MPKPSADPVGTRAIKPTDLVSIRDFGRQDVALGGAPPFSVSPDGKLAAVVLRRADPARDKYCVGVAVIPLDGIGRPRLVDVGGDFILNASDVRDIPDLPIGNAEPITPGWSPDGRQLAYLRRDAGLTRVWLAHADGSGSKPVSKLGIDARSVRWAEDGRSLIVAIRPVSAASKAAFEAEERSGFLYDKRFWTLSSARPRPSLPGSEIEQRIDIGDGRVIDTIRPEKGEDLERPAGAMAFARSVTGARAWTSADDPAVIMGPTSLKVDLGGEAVTCRSSYCANLGALWWSLGKEDELFSVQGATPENGGVTNLFRWRPASRMAPTLILSTVDALIGCRPVDRSILCARETALHPRVLVKVDPVSGGITTLYDPNPDFRALRKGRVERLRWRDAEGVASFADLVLPPDHRPGTRHPMVIVQYQSRGFLRGGTGDEYPIQAFANRGFAVLSVERPRTFAAGVARTDPEFMQMNTAGFAERRRVLASLEAGVQKAIATGSINPDSIGITGLSDGAATVQFALINSQLFRVAALSSCCDEPSTSMFAADRGYSELLMKAGFPKPGEQGQEFWRKYSLAANADRLRTPILLQLTDDEFRLGLETFVTLDLYRVPVEMYVFADGYHQKWRPAHRLATYERALDWFDFWLNGSVDDTPAKHAQYARWRALARRQETSDGRERQLRTQLSTSTSARIRATVSAGTAGTRNAAAIASRSRKP
jgi:hypothetical protein